MWDMTNVSMSDLAGDTMRLMKATMATMAAHYPERSDKLFIVNAPRFFAAMWRVGESGAAISSEGQKEVDMSSVSFFRS